MCGVAMGRESEEKEKLFFVWVSFTFASQKFKVENGKILKWTIKLFIKIKLYILEMIMSLVLKEFSKSKTTFNYFIVDSWYWKMLYMRNCETHMQFSIQFLFLVHVSCTWVDDGVLLRQRINSVKILESWNLNTTLSWSDITLPWPSLTLPGPYSIYYPSQPGLVLSSLGLNLPPDQSKAG